MEQRVYCLYRVSTTKQVDHDENNEADIPVQRKACRDFADRMGWTIVKEEQEQGVSGFKISANERDKIQSIKSDAEKGKFDILLVFMFDRLGRRADETPFVVEWFAKRNIKVWSVQEGEQRFDSHTDHLTNYIRFWQADGESQKTSMRTKVALGQMVQEGRFRGGTPPFGYRLENSGVINKRKHEVKKLVIDEDEAKVIRMIFSLSVGSGYGKVRISRVLNEQGIKPRSGNTWSDSTIGNILNNITYMGILKSGETKSEVFKELQIIDVKTFEQAQDLRKQRCNDYKQVRTVPRNIGGQSLLSGNIFCGHCGGRLTLTTNGTVKRNATGEEITRKRVRYMCYNKTRKRAECDGQSGYTMHIVDNIVTTILHGIFDRMQVLNENDLLARSKKIVYKDIKQKIAQAKTTCASATKEYESLKVEVLKSLQGKSAFPSDILSEMLESSRVKMIEADEKLRMINIELEDIENQTDDINANYKQFLHWAKIYDESEPCVKKMIANYIIKKVSVSRNYDIKIEFNINIEQFELGLDFGEMDSGLDIGEVG